MRSPITSAAATRPPATAVSASESRCDPAARRGGSAHRGPARSSSSTMRASPMSCRRFFGLRSRQRRSSSRSAAAYDGGSRRDRSPCAAPPKACRRRSSPSNSALAGEHLVEHDAERPDVGPLVDRARRAPAPAPCRPPCRGSLPSCVPCAGRQRRRVEQRRRAPRSPPRRAAPPDPSPSPARSREP